MYRVGRSDEPFVSEYEDPVLRYERAALGLGMLRPELCSVLSSLDAANYSDRAHRLIHAAMQRLHIARRPIDIITLLDELARSGNLQAVGGEGYVSSLMDGVPDLPSNIQEYVWKIREAAGIREIARRTAALSQQACEPGASLAQLRAQLSDAAAAAHDYEPSSRIQTIEDIPDPFTLPGGDVEWLVEALIPKMGVTLLSGDPGSGKTWLALCLARGAAMGGEFLGRDVAPSHVLYLDRENPLGLMRERLKIVCGGPGGFNPWGTWCSDAPPVLGDSRLLQLAKTGCLIVFDSLIRFHGADENSATEMSVVMQQLRSLASAGATVFVLHHRAKAESNSYRGSSDILAAVDVALKLGRTEEGYLQISTIKNRFAADLTLTVKPNFAAGQFHLVDSPASALRRDANEILRGIIAASPGINTNKIAEQSGIRREDVIDLLRRGNKNLWRLDSSRRAHRYYPIQLVPGGEFEKVSGTTSGTGPASGSATDSHCSEPLGTTSIGPVSTTLRGGTGNQSLDLRGRNAL